MREGGGLVLRGRKVALAFAVLPVLVSHALLLLARFVQQRTYPDTNYRHGWQIYSAVDTDVISELRERCD